MVDKKSRYYVKSEYSQGIYGDKKETMLIREINVDGNDNFWVKEATTELKRRMMP